MENISRTRPTGVTIIGILTIIGGIVMLISGIALAAVASVVPGLLTMNGIESQIPSMIPASYVGAASLAIGSMLLVLGIVSLIVAFGLFKGKKWAWTTSVALSIISIVMGVVSIVTGNVGSIVGVAISGVVLYYLYRPHVKAYFGKTAQPKAATP